MTDDYLVSPFRRAQTPVFDYKAGLKLRCGVCGNENQDKFLTVTGLAATDLRGFACGVCEEREWKIK